MKKLLTIRSQISSVPPHYVSAASRNPVACLPQLTLNLDLSSAGLASFVDMKRVTGIRVLRLQEAPKSYTVNACFEVPCMLSFPSIRLYAGSEPHIWNGSAN